jgi:hypothetical protein
MWSVWVRGIVIGSATATWGAIIFVPGQLLKARYGALPDWAFVVLLGPLFILLALMVTVALFNRPRFVVPPYLRNEPGAIGALRSQWRKKKSGGS